MRNPSNIAFFTLFLLGTPCSYAQGRFLQQQDQLKAELARAEKHHDTQSAQIISALQPLAESYSHMQNHAMAEQLYRRSLDLQQQKFQNLQGQDLQPLFQERVAIMTRIGYSLLDQNRNGEALAWLRNTEKLAMLGITDPHTEVVRDLRTAMALASAHTLPFEDVSAFHNALLASAQRVYPPNHPVLARILNSWIVILVAQEKRAEAIECAVQSLQIIRNTYGPNHPRMATAQSLLASLYFANGQIRASRHLLKGARKIRTRAFGPDHPITVTARENLASLEETNNARNHAE
jgi:tetratricopeptide (TPR) repeat protein